MEDENLLNCSLPEFRRLQKFYLAIEGTSDQFAIVNAKGRIIYANKAAEALTGYSRRELIGATPDLWAKTIHPPGKNHSYLFKDLFETVLRGGCCFFGEVENRAKTGERYVTDMRITFIEGRGKRPQYFVITERDITATKHLDRLKQEFISISSHELRTPLASISLASELLLRGGKSGHDQKYLLEEIYMNTRKMAHLISTFMDLARIEMGTMVIAPERISAHSAIEKIISESSLQLQSKKLGLEKNFASENDLILFDKKIFNIIFENIISNAIKYTPDGGKISLSTSTSGGRLRIKIEDTGIGIENSQLEKIFDKQFRAENALKTNTEGNGLGLYIVKSLIDKTDADISVSSEIGRGSAFEVSFLLKTEFKGSVKTAPARLSKRINQNASFWRPRKPAYKKTAGK